MTYESFLKNLTRAREQRGFSNRKLGEKAGFAIGHLWRIEKGMAGLTIEKFLRICNILEIEPSKFFEEDQDFGEYTITLDRLKSLSRRDYRLIKDLVMLMSLDEQDL